MVEYKVKVYTSNHLMANTSHYLYITLVGRDGESEQTEIPVSMFLGVGSGTFSISCSSSIGKLELIKLEQNKAFHMIKDSWFPTKVEVESSEDKFTFPVYHWITDGKVYSFREGTALTFQQDTNAGRRAREEELSDRKSKYCWVEDKEGIPHYIDKKHENELPPELTFSYTKYLEFKFNGMKRKTRTWMKEKLSCAKQWTKMADIYSEFGKSSRPTEISEYVSKNWMKDDFFGYQFLNGINPMMIRRCTALPANFPVTECMVSLDGQRSLAEEMENGNIFLCDYKILDGIPSNIINGKKQYLMAPLVLLHKTKDEKMMPIAIQLKQQPGEDNPIFFPNDSHYDWLLAKIFVRSAEFNVHELDSHLLRTHLLSEVFAVSLLRNIPMVHPLYKLLIPHTRYTLNINVLARDRLISENGVFYELTASGGKGGGIFEILKRATSTLTYSSLCIPDDIAERGLEDVPNFFYKEDGNELWGIIHCFVKGILTHYYKNNVDVLNDPELQMWIKEIFEHGFLSRSSSGIPDKFDTVQKLIKFVTMVIFTCSAQHAAVNSGQYDYGAWMPNTPVTLQLPPPIRKKEANEDTMLATFPDINTTLKGLDTMFLLSEHSSDFLHLGKYPEEHFTEVFPKQNILEFQGMVKELSARINARNVMLQLQSRLPYTYLDPLKVENSVSL